MSTQLINIGNRVNDGLGDDLRTAFQKVNANFSSLSAELTVTAINLGVGAGIFKDKVDGQFRFKSLISGRKILIDNDPAESIIINNTAPDAFIRITADEGEMIARPPGVGNQGNITIQGGRSPGINLGDPDIITSTDDFRVKIKTRIPVTSILTTVDFGPITGNITNALQFAFANSNIDFGTISLPSNINLDLGLL